MKRASALLIALIGLGSLPGCGDMRPSLPPPPVILNLPDCPAPERPDLPQIDGHLPFDAPRNIAAILERDDVLRLHIKALGAALECFRRQGSKENR